MIGVFYFFLEMVYLLDGRLVLGTFDFSEDTVSFSVLASDIPEVNTFLESFYGVAPVEVKPRKYNSWVYGIGGNNIRYIKNGALMVEVDGVSPEDRERLTGLVKKVA